MKKLLTMLLALTVCAFVSSAALTQELAKTRQETKKLQKASFSMIIGRVVSADTAANTITVKVKSGTETVNVDSNTKVIKSKKPITLSGITADDMVYVTYKQEQDKKVASKITVKAKKNKK